MKDEIKVRKRKLSEYVRDPNNPNKGSERGRRLLRESLAEVGPARSIVAAADDVLLAGNQTAAAALESGIEDVIEIEAPPGALVVVKRTDIQSGDAKARRLVHADNRSGDFRSYDAEILELDAADGLLDGLFRDDELADLLLDLEVDTEVNAAVDDAAEGETGSRLKKDVRRAVKPVLYADQVAVFERALRATGIVNRGDALIAIYEAYLQSRASQSSG